MVPPTMASFPVEACSSAAAPRWSSTTAIALEASGQLVRARRLEKKSAHGGPAQRFSATSSASMSSAVEMTLLLAWNPR